MPAWLVFLLSGGCVVLAGTVLSRSGDAISERTGLGRVWVGAILVAAATSLPELTTGLYAVRQGDVNLTVGNLFGASMANMLILAVADLTLTRVRVLTRVAINQAVVGTLAVALTATAAVGILTDQHLSLLGLGWAPLAIAFGYIAGMRIIYLNRVGPPFLEPDEATVVAAKAAGLRRAAISFVVAAAVVLVAARYLASSAVTVADQLGITTGFMGIALLAITTSLPEVTVTVASVRAGWYDLAVGNLLGSVAFNMLILLPLDLADRSGPLLAQVEPGVLVGALFACILIGQTLLEILNTSEERIWYLEPGAFFRVATYALGLYLIFQMGS
ncbi:MAG: hypothetical protein DCC58_17420 [Chloroflexi bacterium]|nr:MAG: hypothetical protein DCC58_17420 [Chloroflexota bacterium]